MIRRDFLKNMGLAFVAVTLASKRIALAEDSRRKKNNSDMALVSENDSVAKSIGYITDGKKSKNANGKDCSSCMLYTKNKDMNGKEVGKCSIFPNKLVYAKGYCNSWAKKTT